MAHDVGDTPAGWGPLRGLPMDSRRRAVLVTLAVCAVCSAAIATAVSFLRPYQELNRERERAARVREIVTSVPGLGDVLGSVGAAELRPRTVELETGRVAEDVDPAGFDWERAALDPARSVALPPGRDLAGLGRIPRHAIVYMVRENERLRLVILPVRGAGYLSTLHGYLALDADLVTIRGLVFYEHEETPGLGAEIDNPRWRAQWPGVRVRDETGELRVGVARGDVDPQSPEAAYEVDGISGATYTGQGVTNLLRFWLGPDGFGPFLERLARREESQEEAA